MSARARWHHAVEFRRLLEQHKLGEQLFATVGRYCRSRGLKVRHGHDRGCHHHRRTEFDEERRKARDEMHQTKKGQQWYFGMKMHIGVDSRTGLVHSAVVTAANVHDKHPLPELLHGHEQRVYGDSAYASQKELISRRPAGAGLPISACAGAAR